MNRLSILFLLLTPGLLKAGAADTIPFCHVYLNGKNILSINRNDFEHAGLQLKSISQNDTLKIYYFTDHPSNETLTFEIRDSKGTPLILRSATADNKTPIYIFASELKLLDSCTVYKFNKASSSYHRILTIALSK